MALYSRDSARRSLIDTVAWRALSQVATITGYVVLVRHMAANDFGVLNLLYAFLPAVSTIASLGLDQVLRRYQPEYLRGGNLPAALWLVRFVASARFATNVVILGLVLAAWPLVAPTVKLLPYRAEFLLFCAVVLLHFQAQVLQAALGSHMLHRYAVGATATLAYVRLAGYGVLAWAGRLDLESAILVDTLGYGIMWAGLRLAYRRHCVPVPPPPAWRPDPEERRRLLRYGFYNNFNDAGSLLLSSKSDNFFIAAIIDPLSVAVYAFYTRFNEMVTGLLPVRLFDNVVNPMFFAIRREDAAARIPTYFSLLLDLNLALQWPFWGFVAAFHAEIVEVLFGGKYVEHSWLMVVIASFGIVNAFATPVTMVAQYHERAGVILASKLLVAVNVGLLLLLVPRWGVYGAAVSSGVANVGKNLFIWGAVRREARWLSAAGVVGTHLLLWGGSAAAWIFAKPHLSWPPLALLVAGGLWYGLVGLVALRSPVLTSGDREVLGSLLKGRESSLFRRLGLLRAAS
jgi:O-antigen/teichoic acid export membrane protein